MILNSETKIYTDRESFPGVKRVAGKLAEDFSAVFGKKAEVKELEGQLSSEEGSVIIAATLGHSAYLDKLITNGDFDRTTIEGKWEVYSFMILPAKEGEPERLLIAGSDKRGTIYGLFHVSELMGVSPWYWFADVTPEKKSSVEITSKDCFVSKVPSVKYRGFFINDEWPAFGNWTFKHFGGFTAEMYDHVFELLLRLKGNYLWPAMWTSNFSLDGPGLENARLADEYGVVMSNSHHEPCLRHSEEWDLVKGEDTPYGTAWNFDKNREGLTNYWRGGLQRNGKFENIITMGMRGERDSEVLGATATLKDNIDYIKDVVTTQNKLIKETISEDLDSVPRMIAIYKEVEKYFHGDENAEGLKHWDGLDGITCMLCEDNFGNLRTLPEEWHRERKGGWGMYYHFDYHGDPISYEWINSTHIARTCEQMSQAYDYGIREIWIVNVGDLKPQEFPLSYFLDLAYDIDKWGQENENAVKEYTEHFVDVNFPTFDAAQKKTTYNLLEGYTRLNYTRKPEALNPDVYDATAYDEASAVLAKAGSLSSRLVRLWPDLKDDPLKDAFYQLVYYPVMAATNLITMQVLAGGNHYLAGIGAVKANEYAEKIKKCIETDRELVREYHSINGGKWDGMMLSEHIGFTHWNDEECAYPVIMQVEPANRPRMIVTAGHVKKASQGGDWTRQKLVIDELLDPHVDTTFITVLNGSDKKLDISVNGVSEGRYVVENAAPDWLTVGLLGIGLKFDDMQPSDFRLMLTLDREKLKASGDAKNGVATTTLTIATEHTHVDVEVWAGECDDREMVPMLNKEQLSKETEPYIKDFVVTNELGLTLEASDVKRISGSEGEYRIIEEIGKYGSGLKAFPTTKYFDPEKGAPCAEYEFKISDASYEEMTEGGKVPEVKVTILTAPNNPVVKGNPMQVGISVNDSDIKRIATVTDGYEGGERSCPQWAKGVLDQEHRVSFNVPVKAGTNTLRIYAIDPGVLIERILIRQAGTEWRYGYLGKTPDWIKKIIGD